MKLSTALLTFSLLGTAPFQCTSRGEDPNRRVEDSPAEALWNLSERFRADGNDAARRTTLEQLVEQYPSSREAQRARLVLDGREVAPNSPAAPTAPPAAAPANANAQAEAAPTAPPSES